MTSWARQGNPNVPHVLALLDAETAVLKRKNKLALQKYEEAVQLSLEGGFIHEASIANERWADFAAEVLGDEDMAELRMQEAVRLSQEWGAGKRVSRIREEYPRLLTRMTSEMFRAGGNRLGPTTTTVVT